MTESPARHRVAGGSLACAVAIAPSFVNVYLTPLGFPFIPLFARLFDPARPGAAAELPEVIAGNETPVV